MNRSLLLATLFAVIYTVISGCTGQMTFSDYARAGETVAIAAGWKTNFNKNNITVTITPSVGPNIVIPPGDPAIRAAVNMYPDPVSSAVVTRETGVAQTFQSNVYVGLINGITGDDKDWYQTTILLDLPGTLPLGTTSITVSNPQGDTATSTVEIIDSGGQPHQFVADSGTAVNNLMLLSMQRTTNYAINFDTTTTVPFAIEVTLTHDADAANGGTGTALAINHLGVNKNLLWTDDGFNMKAILLPAAETSIDHINDFKFYVAGKINNLAIGSIAAYDINGVPVDGITATVTQYNM